MTTTEPTDALRVVGYIRVSTEEQRRSGAGLAAQRRSIESACRERGWTLLRIEADEAASAKTTRNRPGYARAVETVESGEAAGLVVAKLDRLSRSVRDFCEILDASAKQGWALVCLDLGLDTSTPTGRFTAQIIAAVAELERKMIGQRTREGLERVRAKGVRLGGPVAIDEALADRIRAMRKTGATLEGICEGTQRGGRADATWRRGGRPSSIVRVLRR